MDKGLIFDGFTYFKPQISPQCKESEYSYAFEVKEVRSETGEKAIN